MTAPSKTGHDFYLEAVRLRNSIVAGQSVGSPIMNWAAVCRACAKANNAYRAEFDSRAKNTGYTRFELNQLDNLDRVWWTAKAQVETLSRKI